MRYDALNRLVVSASQGADGSLSTDLSDDQTLFTLFGYDSRNNRTLLVDPKGNTSLSLYDGANRLVEARQHLRQDGDGSNGPEANQSFEAEGGASVRTLTVYDGNGRTIALIDDRGSTTAYRYDTLDRQTEMEFADGSRRTSAYNDASDLTSYTDENGSIFAYSYDAMGRKTACSITKTSGVLGTDSQSFEYDGLSRLTRSLDTISSTSAEARFFFDSISRVVEESQSYGGNTRNVTHNAFTSSPVTGFTFPDDRALTNAYDLLYRKTLVEETSGGADIAAWKFFGPARVAEVTLANGLACTSMNNARTHSAVQSTVSNPAWGNVSSDRLGYDGAGRMIAKRYLPSALNGSNGYYDTTALIGFTTEFDRASNKLFDRHLHAENRSYLYNSLDSMNRLREYQRGTLATGGPTVASATTLPGTDSQRSYDLDGLGNWRRLNYTPVGGSATTEVRQHNPLNQITRTDSTRLAYDDNGNLTDDGTLLLEYDPFNRLKRVKNASNSQTVGEYTYDASGKRIRKVITNGGITGTISNGTTDYLYD